MAQNIFRFTLSHTSGSQVISEPEGWAKIRITLERDKDFHGLVELIETPLVFYGSNGVHDGGRNYLKDKASTYGVDAQINILIEISDDEGITYDDLFYGLIDIQSFQDIDSRKLQAAIIRNDLWAKFKNRYDTSVDLKSSVDLDDNAITPVTSITALLTSQKIKSAYTSTQTYSMRIGGNYASNIPDPYGCNAWPADSYNNTQFIQLDPDSVELDEITKSYNIGSGVNPERPVSKWDVEYAGEYTFDLYVGMSYYRPLFPTPDWQNTSAKVTWFIQINDLTPIPFVTNDFIDGSNQEWTRYDYNDTLTLEANDKVRIYGQILQNPIDPLDYLILWGAEDLNFCNGSHQFDKLDGAFTTHFNVTANTVFPDTTCESFFLHDAGGAVCDIITGQSNSFYSEYLGSSETVYRSYIEDGCGWKFVLMRGLQIRQYTLSQKPFSLSFKDWWEGINPIANLGLSYDVVDDVEVIRVEEKRFFYNDSPILYFDWVNNITESYDKDYIFKKIRIGYKKWQSEDVSGIDDPQTNHDYASILKISGVDIVIQSNFIAASLAIEKTRRTTKQKTADYKFDNDTFIVAIQPESIDDEYLPELDENFDSVSNLLNSETRYNLILTPARNMLRWLNYLTAGLQNNLSDNLKFTYGEGNYDMIGDYDAAANTCFNIESNSLSEKQNIDISTSDHLFKAIPLEFRYPLSYQNYKLIKQNRTRAIAVSETDADHRICHIKKLEYDMINSLGTFTVWIK